MLNMTHTFDTVRRIDDTQVNVYIQMLEVIETGTPLESVISKIRTYLSFYDQYVFSMTMKQRCIMARNLFLHLTRIEVNRNKDDHVRFLHTVKEKVNECYPKIIEHLEGEVSMNILQDEYERIINFMQ